MMTDGDRDVIARGYDQVADEYAALESPDAPWPRLKRVQAFAATLAQDSRVLDIGCGNGVPATRELALKHEVIGIDISAEQVARAKANVPNATFICGDVRDADGLPTGTFDAIVALYLVDNVPSGDYPRLFRRLTELLRPNGQLLLSAEPGNDPWQPYTWLGVRMFINTIPAQTLVRLLEGAGLRIRSTEFESQLEGGRLIEYVWIIAENRPH
jgi:cyclopropane fatty-acyl-phospholipid synthase-like methyltransferase